MHIDREKCVACGNCVAVCPMGAIYVDPAIKRCHAGQPHSHPAHQTRRSEVGAGFCELALPSDFLRNLVAGDLPAAHTGVTAEGGGWIGELRSFQSNQITMVEASAEKADVGGSIPSRAPTVFDPSHADTTWLWFGAPSTFSV
jgi:ferredoxin